MAPDRGQALVKKAQSQARQQGSRRLLDLVGDQILHGCSVKQPGPEALLG